MDLEVVMLHHLYLRVDHLGHLDCLGHLAVMVGLPKDDEAEVGVAIVFMDRMYKIKSCVHISDVKILTTLFVYVDYLLLAHQD